MLPFKAMWNKFGSDPSQGPVPVIVLGFSTATIADSPSHRPVAIIQDESSSGLLRFVELRFLYGQAQADREIGR